jgi:hypothetical protein
MALLLAWVSLGACGLLSAVCFILYSDRKGQEKALAALQAQVTGLSRDVAALSGTADPGARYAMLPSAPPVSVEEATRLAAEVAPSDVEGPAPQRPPREARATMVGMGGSPALAEPRMETAKEAAARLRKHCGQGPFCRSFLCSCACTGCVQGRGDDLPAGPRR